MNIQLVPFEKSTETQAIGLSVGVSCNQEVLNCRFELLDPKSLIIVPDVKVHPARMRGLWKSTCFEIFWKDSSQTNYWEFNLSPTLDWNVFCFQSYRSDTEKEDARFESVKCSLKKIDSKDSRILIDVSLDLKQGGYDFKSLQVSCTAVLEHKSGSKSYWALKHPGEKPDFHHQDSFIRI